MTQNDERMYVLVLDSLPTGHKACQGGHAVAQYLLNKNTDWTNGNMIYLNASEEQLRQFACDPEAVEFCEEDFDNQLTALATVTTDRKKFAKLDLV